MAAELGHEPSRSYIDGNGAFHTNGAAFYNADENDIAAQLNSLDTIATADLTKIDGITDGTIAASKAIVVDANKDAAAARNFTAINLLAGVNGASGSTGTVVFRNGANPGSEINIGYDDAAQIDGITPGTAAASKAVVLDASAGISGLGLTSCAVTVTSATPSTTRLVRSELTVTPATSVAVGSNGSLAGVRGCVTLTAGKSITDGYIYGVQGKAVLDGATVAVGSDHVAGVYAQLSASGTTVTNGHVAILSVSGQSLPASANVNAIYVESGGNKINSVLQSNVACDFFMDINNFESCGIIATPTGATASGNLRTIKVQIDGATYYLLAAAVFSS